jgi:hypothetical protein
MKIHSLAARFWRGDSAGEGLGGNWSISEVEDWMRSLVGAHEEPVWQTDDARITDSLQGYSSEKRSLFILVEGESPW